MRRPRLLAFAAGWGNYGAPDYVTGAYRKAQLEVTRFSDPGCPRAPRSSLR